MAYCSSIPRQAAARSATVVFVMALLFARALVPDYSFEGTSRSRMGL